MLRRLFLLLLAGVCAAEEPHLRYRELVKPAPPTPADARWCRNELDRFVLDRIEQAGLYPSPPSDAGTLLRRVSLDLTGLPPTREEAADFLRDPSPAQYERTVDRLLASPRFGERWAAWWLDAARYADTQGYEKDNLRVAWSYRDWVIQAFNDDQPFDRFTIEQLAGDLLPKPTPRQLTATAFHRNTMTNTEGGTNAEEFRIKAVLDRVNTTAQVWLGTTLACAQCHDHPNNGFTQRDYFGFFAFFNNTEDANDADDRPLLTHYPLQEEARVAELEADAGSAEARRQLEEIPTTTVPIMRELPAERARTTHLFRRGNWLEPGEAIAPATPAALWAMPQGAPRNRLGLAQWLVAPENPVTPRVIVNRVWAQFFGREITAADEFGPSDEELIDPGLLDQLAWSFAREGGWSLKKLMREIVLSATYRQSSRLTDELRVRDPQNRLCARASRFRLPAEMLRDQALAASGLLSAKMYGRSVMPPQPEGQWQVVYNIQRWTVSRGEDAFRRSLYTFWRRTSPFPALASLDVPTRESCTTRRSSVTTPLAALAMLNDATAAAAAQALAGRMMREGGTTTESRLAFGYELLLCEKPSASTLEALRTVYEQARAKLSEEAAFGVAANVLLNLDAAWMHE
ncbi:MAG TPA: DUF1549 and DUF1553 domain-containing protein [Chthoniobacteraceae bacterium]|jgi:hypothetical protein|nr:DUF1549 and DUF1553 domain-containing protein [Chthoniobacteraceae bacterium]